ncbi:cytochrome P450 2K1-like [Notolabrus celidotus]|uniref:cytochrome P450 2K1-like n=1 Tax=Notolabrus celidotus TaxID=1203425 RepID=UPI0014902B9B|nr:cytochrome P450 2K1-like [Notolabrus celidotus]
MSLLEDFVSFLFYSPTTVLGAAALLLFLWVLLSGSLNSDEGRKEPPGPKPLPLLGNLLQLDLKRPYRTLCELSKKYGSVFTVHIGPNKVVVLAGYKAVKEALVGYAEEFGERHIFPIFYDVNQGHGILFANGESWKELRRFALTTLKDFGMGKRIAEERILEECQHLIQVFEHHEGKPFDSSRPVNHATSNVISSIVYGSRFEYDDPRFQCMVKTACDTISVVGTAQIQIFNMFPRLFCWIKNRQHILRNTETLVKSVKEITKTLKETLNLQICRGLVDCFLIRKQKDEDSCNMDSFYNENNLIFTITNLFAAGTDTTATTLSWAFLYMAKYPHIQQKVHEELSKEMGSREVRVDDRKNLPYIDAVIHETQRLANIVPTSLPHQTSQDITFQGYFIKKGTIVFPLLTSVLQDESEWKTPYTFNPSHFLDEEGKFMKRDAFMPFSAGRRMCLGEGLAKMELFLFFTSVLQRFRFTPPPGVTEDDLDLIPAVGLVLRPSLHELCAVSHQ